jgi:hypothetical protein
MSNKILKMLPKQFEIISKNNFILKSSLLQSIIIEDTYNHFRYINESNFSEYKYKTLNDVHKYFCNFAPKSDYLSNYTEEIETIFYSLKEFKVETLPAILFSKNFEILALKNENITMNDNLTQIMLIDIEKLKEENKQFIMNSSLK